MRGAALFADEVEQEQIPRRIGKGVGVVDYFRSVSRTRNRNNALHWSKNVRRSETHGEPSVELIERRCDQRNADLGAQVITESRCTRLVYLKPLEGRNHISKTFTSGSRES